jgi:ribonuclease D
MKDDLDNLTIELPLYEPALHVLERLLTEKPNDYVRWQAVQHWERHALRTADLEMLRAVRDWRKKQARYKPKFIIRDNRYIWQL